jgi:hypothetical protein
MAALTMPSRTRFTRAPSYSNTSPPNDCISAPIQASAKLPETGSAKIPPAFYDV